MSRGTVYMRAFAYRLRLGTNKQRFIRLNKRIGVVLSTLVVACTGLAQPALAAPGDVAWREGGPAEVVGNTMNWQSIASSADGSKLAAVVDGGSVYTSNDYGATWVKQTGAGTRRWSAIDMSDDGSKLVASFNDGGGYIYTSVDYGVKIGRASCRERV